MSIESGLPSASTPTTSSSLASAVVPSLPLAFMLAPPSMVINVASIKTHIPITLNLKTLKYTKWCTFFTAMLDKFGILRHVITPPLVAPNAEWGQQDFMVLTWLYGSITKDVLDIIMEPSQIAYALWSAAEDLFIDNKESHVPYLEAEFSNLAQGDLTVNVYC